MKNTELSVCPLCLPLVGLFLCLFSTQLLPWDPSSLGTYRPPADSEVCDSSHPVGSQTTKSCVVVVVYLLLRGSRDYFLLSG